MPLRTVDFLFAAAGIAPLLLVLAEQPVLAAMSCLALMVGGAVTGIADPEAPHHAAPRNQAPATRTSRPTPSPLSPSAPSRRG